MDGSGTELDPWLITTIAEFVSLLRDASASGFYKIANDLGSSTVWGMSSVGVGVGATYAPKVIDGDGHTVRFSGAQLASLESCMFAGVHFRNIRIFYAVSLVTSSWVVNIFYRCSLEDVAVGVSTSGSASPATRLINSDSSTPFVIPRAIRRIALLDGASPSVPVGRFITLSVSGVTPSQCYVYTNGTPSAGLTRRAEPLTLEALDGLTGRAFSDAGWWQSGADIIPFQSEQVGLTLQTIAAGASVSRKVWIENERQVRLIGETDAEGLAQLNVRIRRRSSFTLLASEDYGVSELWGDLAIVAAGWYLPPADNGFVYQAGSAGRITSLAGVVFDDQSVTIDGIVFTPRAAYRAVMSARRSVHRNGSSQTVILDNSSGGGGPVIDGDPAYLDGVVEEVHPALGTVRPLANSEVSVFERRGDAYVAMGRALSNAVGEFRVETQVYGGGDVFAFSTDFPGVVWSPGAALNLGNRLRPTTNNGYVYEIVEAGVSGAIEPAWWADQGDGTEGYIGTARAKARPYYQPVGHGPLQMTLVDP